MIQREIRYMYILYFFGKIGTLARGSGRAVGLRLVSRDRRRKSQPEPRIVARRGNIPNN